MLELLRKDATYFFSKILLGFIVIVFILYFGFSFRQGGPEGTGSPIASVNGQNIPAGMFTQDLENQASIYKQLGQGDIPDNIKSVIENQVLQRLIANSLFAQEAQKLGLRVPDIELAGEIRNNPVFHKDGQFNEDFYLNQFKPYYERENGQDYEYNLKQELLSEKLRNALEAAAVVSVQQAQDSSLLKASKLNIRKLTIPLEEEGELNKEKALSLAKEWITVRQAGNTPQDLLKNPKLKEEETTPQSLQEMQIALGAEDSLPILSCLLKIQSKQVCEEPFQVGNSIVAVQLVERKDETPPADEVTAMSQQLRTAKKNQILSGANDLLIKRAKIETYLQNR